MDGRRSGRSGCSCARQAAILVALVQTADSVPDFVFAVVGGVPADPFDRRRLLPGCPACLHVAGILLTVLTIADAMPSSER